MVDKKFLDEILEGLCKFPHRYSTTREEKEASVFLEGKLKELSLSPEIEGFRCHTTFSSIYAILYGGFAFSILLHLFFPWAGLIMMLIILALYFGEQTTFFSPLSRIVPRGDSQNVIAKIPCEGRPDARLVLVAHYDTSKTSLLFAPGSVRFLRLSYLIGLFLIASSIAVMAMRLIFPSLATSLSSVTGIYLAIAFLILLYSTFIMVHRDIKGVFVNGAADNATGSAVVMELSRWLKGRGGIPGCDVTVLLSGAEEVGLAGMMDYFKRHEKELDKDKTLFINFDNLGGGDLCYLISEGMLCRLHSDPELIAVARELSMDESFRGVKGRDFNALTLDTLVPHARGYRVTAFIGLNEHGVAYPWHWFNDTIENVDREVMYKAAAFGKALIQRHYRIQD